jgi:hypothetical protein
MNLTLAVSASVPLSPAGRGLFAMTCARHGYDHRTQDGARKSFLANRVRGLASLLHFREPAEKSLTVDPPHPNPLPPGEREMRPRRDEEKELAHADLENPR